MAWIMDHKLAIYFGVFLLIVVFSILLYPAAGSGAIGWIWFSLLGIVVCNFVIFLLR